MFQIIYLKFFIIWSKRKSKKFRWKTE